MTTIESTTTTKDPTTTTTELATTIVEPTSEITDPCLRKKFGNNPRDAMIGLDPKCEENFKTISETDLTEEDFDYIFEESLALTKKDLIKAVPTTTEIIKTTAIEETTTSEKTDSSPCLKKGIGINPRDLDSNCEENLTISKSENQSTSPLPPCKLDIRLGDPESDITFDTEKCDPTITTTKSATTIAEPTTTMTESTTTITKSTTNNTEPTETIETTGLLPPCKLDIRFDYPESDITFDTEMCDPLPIDSAKIDMNK